MKLFWCPGCAGIVRLRQDKLKYCHCETSWGKYLDQEHAIIGGDAVPMAIDNDSIKRAITNIDSDPTFFGWFVGLPHHRWTHLGNEEPDDS